MKAMRWLAACAITGVLTFVLFGQDDAGMDMGDMGGEYTEEPQAAEPAPDAGGADDALFQEQSPDMTAAQGMPQMSIVQNAVLEGIQLSSEKGAEPDEISVTCYFIFRIQI